MKVINYLKQNCRKITTISGFVGTAVIIIAILLTAIPYQGTYGQRYSFLNHNISELGEVGVSQNAAVFNLGLIVGGLCFILFMISFSFLWNRKIMHLISLVGIVAAIGIIFVGVFPVIPEESLAGHTIAALTFFLGGFIYFFLLTLYLLFSKQTNLPKWFAILSAIVTLSYVAFLFLPSFIYSDLNTDTMLAGPSGPDRPTFWLPSFLEWMILFTVIGWIIAVSWYLFREEEKSSN